MGSKSDLVVMGMAVGICKDFGVPYELDIISAHRTPKKLYDYASSAESRGVEVIIAGAGGAAHLPGMTAALTIVPVIGVPVETKTLHGMDSLLSIVQMPHDVPVATVAINAAGNAALLAISILARQDRELAQRLRDFRTAQEKGVMEDAKNIGK